MSVARARVLLLARRVVGRIASVLPDAVLRKVLPAGQRPVDASAANGLSAIMNTGLTGTESKTRLLIGPTNSAGQGWQWARAAEQHLPDVAAVSMRAGVANDFGHPVDQSVPLGTYRWSHAWRKAQRGEVFEHFTHVIVESGRPLFSDLAGSVPHEVTRLQQHGARVALLFHGTDIRLPSRHAANEPWSPFQDALWNKTGLLQAQAEANARLVDSSSLPVFYSTPDLLLDLPGATWLPVVIDPKQWQTRTAPFAAHGVPLVAHAPSRSIVKGSDLVDPILQRLDAQGVIEYRRVAGVQAKDMPNVYSGVDIVLDQFRIGNYGVAACEAMAAGRIVVSHVSEFVRAQVLEHTGRELPIIEATASTLEDTVRAIIDEPERYREIAEAGVTFATEVHDGRRSAGVLSEFLGRSG